MKPFTSCACGQPEDVIITRYNASNKDPEDLPDADLVRWALEAVGHLENQTEKARRLGVSEATVRRWLSGRVAALRRDTRRALEEFLRHRIGRTRSRSSETASPGVVEGDEGGRRKSTAAEELLAHLRQRAGLRRLARELTDKDLIAVAYTLARKDDWSVQELRKLDDWRDEILGKDEDEGARRNTDR